MNTMLSRTPKLVATALLTVVVTQIAYLTVQGEVITGRLLWSIEAFAFLTIALVALLPSKLPTGGALGWVGLGVFGLLNLTQVGIGLTMFGPLTSGDGANAQVFEAVLAFAFFLYFTAKFAIAITAVVFGMVAMSSASATVKAAGIFAIGAGLAALAANGAAMVLGREVMLNYAGATGTAATLAAAIILLISGARNSQLPPLSRTP